MLLRSGNSSACAGMSTSLYSTSRLMVRPSVGLPGLWFLCSFVLRLSCTIDTLALRTLLDKHRLSAS